MIEICKFSMLYKVKGGGLNPDLSTTIIFGQLTRYDDSFLRRSSACRLRGDNLFTLDIEQYCIIILAHYCVPYFCMIIGRLH